MYDSQEFDLADLRGIWDPFPPCHHQGTLISPGRLVAFFIDHAWSYTPEICQASTLNIARYLGGRLELCNGCGVDLTQPPATSAKKTRAPSQPGPDPATCPCKQCNASETEQ